MRLTDYIKVTDDGYEVVNMPWKYYELYATMDTMGNERFNSRLLMDALYNEDPEKYHKIRQAMVARSRLFTEE
jgi:hypothetical protein